MRYEVYCDESRPDLLAHAGQRSYMLIGGLWLSESERPKLKQHVREMRLQYGIGGEAKWQKVSSSALPFYAEFIKYFIATPGLRFRCIAVNVASLDLVRYHEGDQELGFYKFYYQLLNHWMSPESTYRVFCDMKSNRRPDRLQTLQKCINNSHVYPLVEQVHSVASRESSALQLCDLLLGAASSRMNDSLTLNGAKSVLLRGLEDALGVPRIGPTSLYESKFNVFEMRMRQECDDQ